MIDPAGDYQEALSSLEDTLRNAIKAFAAWYAREWQLSREQWVKDFAEPLPEGDWFDGHNRGVQSAVDAAEHFLGEFHP